MIVFVVSAVQSRCAPLLATAWSARSVYWCCCSVLCWCDCSLVVRVDLYCHALSILMRRLFQILSAPGGFGWSRWPSALRAWPLFCNVVQRPSDLPCAGNPWRCRLHARAGPDLEFLCSRACLWLQRKAGLVLRSGVGCNRGAVCLFLVGGTTYSLASLILGGRWPIIDSYDCN